jgi:hypothetical protein
MAGTGGSTAGTGFSSGGTGGSAGTPATGGGAGAGAGGTGAGAGGTAGSGVTAGAGGSTAGAGGAMAGMGGSVATGGVGGMAAGSGGTAGSGGPPGCPSGALFCSGFEDAMLPAGATYLSSNDNNDWTKGTALDKTTFNSGQQSIEILKIASYSQREIVVPAAQNFWFRAYMRTDVAIGGPMGNNHNLFFEAAFGEDKGVEIVEEDCMLGMNIADTRFGSNGTKNQPGCPTSGDMGTQLAADTWHCVEGHFDGTTGNVEVFVGGTQVMAIMNEAGAKKNYSTLRFGYRHYHERQRLMWYDDVATAAARIGCQ